MLCNSVRVSVYHVSILRAESLSDKDDLHQGSWKLQTVHQSPKEYGFKDYIFALAMKYRFIPDNEENGKISDEGISRRIPLSTSTWQCTWARSTERQSVSNATDIQKQSKYSKIWETVERKTFIPRDVMYFANQWKMLNDKQTIEENNIEAETTIEMSLRVLGGMEKVGLMNTTEIEGEREKTNNVGRFVRRWIDTAKWRCGVLKNRDNRCNQKISRQVGKLFTENGWKDGQVTQKSIKLKKRRGNQWN